MLEVLKFQYCRRLRTFRVSGKGWVRLVTEEFLSEALADKPTMINRILCEGRAA